MSEFEFGQNKQNTREYLPQHGGIDWHHAYLSRHGDEPKSAWGETFDELGEFCEQLHQENCAFYLNSTDSTFDVVVVIDHRDEGGDFWFTREQVGTYKFDQLVDALGKEVMMVYTKYPAKNVVEYVMKTLLNDIM